MSDQKTEAAAGSGYAGPAGSAPDETPRWLIALSALLLVAFCLSVIAIGFAYGGVAGCLCVAGITFWLLRATVGVMRDNQEKPNNTLEIERRSVADER